MTISISGTASGSKLNVLKTDGFKTSVENGAFSFGISKGQAAILTEEGDTTEYVGFKFGLRQYVKIKDNERNGTVVGRSDGIEAKQHQFLVRHVNGVGDVTDVWFYEDQLTAA